MAAYFLNCKSCGASIDYDPDQDHFFCPYCGEKIIIDSKILSVVDDKKEAVSSTAERSVSSTSSMEKKTAKIVEWIINLFCGIGSIGLVILAIVFGDFVDVIKDTMWGTIIGIVVLAIIICLLWPIIRIIIIIICLLV